MKGALAYSFVILSLISMLCLEALGQAPVAKDWMPEARLTIRVLDELAAPVQGATVRLGFQDKTTGDMKLVSGPTDSSGKFAGQGGTVEVVGCDIRKEGCYVSGAAIPHFTNSAANRWQPWDATYTSVLRKIEKPIPMYAKKVFLHVPQLGKPCGYDLKEGDWLAPWGKGIVPDFVFTMNCTYRAFADQDVSMKLTFSNPLDGIQPANLPKEHAYSTFIWDRQAPEAGYSGSFEMEFGLPNEGFKVPGLSRTNSIEAVEALKYYFRVRTVVKDGKIVSGLYGKLSQGFFIGATSSTNVNVRTCYYLNPTPLDRNMEFDPKRNLFTSMTVMEKVHKP